MSHAVDDELDISKVIETYLEGLHNPSDNGLYNELRAKRDTENLKATVNKMVAQAVTAKLREVRDAIPKPSGLNTDFDRGYDKAIQHMQSDIKTFIERYTALLDSEIDNEQAPSV